MRRLLAGLLVFVMLFGILPTATFAEDTNPLPEAPNEEILPKEDTEPEITVLGNADRYAIEVQSPLNGSIVLSGDTEGYAAPGTEITVTVTPADGYVLEAFYINNTDVSASVIESRYSFSMPAETVYIAASFGFRSAAGALTDTIRWSLNYTPAAGETPASGVLTISGTGAMPDYSTGSLTDRPWNLYGEYIYEVVVSEGITAIGNNSFSQLGSLKAAGLPTGLLRIGESAFANCGSLKSVTLPASLSVLEQYAFLSCSALETADLSATQVTEIRSQTFYLCRKLTTVRLPQSLITIGGYAFGSCTLLQQIALPNTLQTIAERAFASTGLTEIDLPEGIVSVGYQAFSGLPKGSVIRCPVFPFPGTGAYNEGNTSLIYTNGETVIDRSGELAPGIRWSLHYSPAAGETPASGVLTISGTGAMPDYSTGSLTDRPWNLYGEYIYEVVVSEGITAIGNNSFSQLGSLKAAGLPTGLLRIGESAFANCGSLKSVTLPASLSVLKQYAFLSCSALETIDLSATQISAIESQTFYLCPKLTTIKLPQSLITIGGSAFGSCTLLQQIALPNTLQTIAEGAFASTGLTEIDLPEGIVSVGYQAFAGLPEGSVIRCPVFPFPGTGAYSEGSTSLIYTGGETTIDRSGELAPGIRWSLHYSPAADETPASGVLTISGTGAMPDYSTGRLSDRPWNLYGDYIYEVVVSEGITAIGSNSFSRLGSLKTAVLPAGLLRVGESAFANCGSLKRVSFPASLSVLEQYAFLSCSALETADLSATQVTEIGSQAFYLCPKLITVRLPQKLITIGGYAFGSCTLLQQIEFPNTLQTIAAGAFASTGLITITLPYNTTSIGDNAFANLPEGSVITRLRNLPLNPACYTPSRTSVIFAATIASGACGENCSWTLGSDGLLSITGSGNMGEYDRDGAGSTAPWNQFRSAIKRVIIGSGITDVGATAFRGCTELESVTIPDSVRTVGGRAFAYCASLKDTGLREGIVSLGQYAYAASGVTSVTLPDSLRLTTNDSLISMSYAFENCTALESVTFPKGSSLYATGINMFAGCTALKEVIFPEGSEIYQISNSTFLNCSALEHIELPTSVQIIGPSTFQNCTALKACVIPEGVPFARNQVFSGCSSLEYVSIPSSATELQSSCFADCTALKTISVSGNVGKIAANAFLGSSIDTILYEGSSAQWNAIDGSADCGIPAESIFCFGETTPIPETFYYILAKNDSFNLSSLDYRFTRLLDWKAENPDGRSVLELDGNTVKAVDFGTAYVTASLTVYSKTIRVAVRFDVTQGSLTAEPTEAADGGITGVVLPGSKVTVKLFSTDYTQFDILLLLRQNTTDSIGILATESLLPENEQNRPTASSAAITAIRFEETEQNPLGAQANALFDLVPAGDRSIRIVPNYAALEAALANSKSVQRSYHAKLVVTIDGREFTTPTELTVSVDQTKPKLKASAIKFNAFDAGNTQTIKISGGTITDLTIADDATVPEWLIPDCEARTLSLSTITPPTEFKKGSVTLLATVAGYAVKLPVTISYSFANKAPSLKLKTSAVTLLPGSCDAAAISYSVSPAEFGSYAVSVEKITETASGTTVDVENGHLLAVEVIDGTIKVSAPTAPSDGMEHNYQVYLKIADKTAVLKVKTLADGVKPSMKLKATGSIDLRFDGSPVMITPELKGIHKSGTGYPGSFEVLSISGTKKGAEPIAEAIGTLFEAGDYDAATNSITITAIPGTEIDTGYTYTATLGYRYDDTPSAVIEASVKLSVKCSTEKTKPSFRVKASGSIDVLRYGSEIKLTPTVKNCWQFNPESCSFRFYKKTGSGWVPSEEAPFRVEFREGAWYVTAKAGAVSTDKYGVTVSAELYGEVYTAGTAGSPIALTMKQGSVKLNQTISSSSLYIRDRYSKAMITLTAADSTLKGIQGVVLDDSSAKLFDLKDMGNGTYLIGWKNNLPDSGIKAGTKTIKLLVTMEGNETEKASVTLNFKLSIK